MTRRDAARIHKLGAAAPVSDPLSSIRTVLIGKQSLFLAAVRVSKVRSRSPTAAEEKRRYAAISSWRFDRVDAAYRATIEKIGMEFYSSPGRALRILDEVLGRAFSRRSKDRESWFSEKPEVSGLSSTSFSSFVDAVLAPATTDEAEATRRQQALDGWERVLRTLTSGLNVGIRSLLGERLLLISAIDRFRLRCERHDVERMRKVALSKRRKEDKVHAEIQLTKELARYLFDAGFDVFSEVPSGKGRADLVHFGEVYVEAKQVRGRSPSGDRKKIINGYLEAMDGARQFVSPRRSVSVKSVVLAVYVLGGPRYSQLVIPAQLGAIETHVITIDLRLARQRGSQQPQSPVQLTADEFLSGLAAGGPDARRTRRRKRGSDRIKPTARMPRDRDDGDR